MVSPFYPSPGPYPGPDDNPYPGLYPTPSNRPFLSAVRHHLLDKTGYMYRYYSLHSYLSVNAP